MGLAIFVGLIVLAAAFGLSKLANVTEKSAASAEQAMAEGKPGKAFLRIMRGAFAVGLLVWVGGLFIGRW